MGASDDAQGKQGVQERLEPGREKAAVDCLAAEIHSKWQLPGQSNQGEEEWPGTCCCSDGSAAACLHQQLRLHHAQQRTKRGLPGWLGVPPARRAGGGVPTPGTAAAALSRGARGGGSSCPCPAAPPPHFPPQSPLQQQAKQAKQAKRGGQWVVGWAVCLAAPPACTAGGWIDCLECSSAQTPAVSVLRST